MKVDGLLRDFKIYYSGERIDSVRRILAEKEMHLFEISHLYDEQMELHTEMTKLVPVIANETIQEQKKKKWLLWIVPKEGTVTFGNYHQIIFTQPRGNKETE